MSTVGRKYPSINILHLYNTWNAERWNQFLSNAYAARDMESLVKAYYGLQSGMDDLVKQKLNTEKLVNVFIRWQRSLENTMKAIQRAQIPNPCDNPLRAKDHLEALAAKRERDHELEMFFKKVRF